MERTGKSQMIRVAIDVRVLTHDAYPSGVGQYIIGLLKALASVRERITAVPVADTRGFYPDHLNHLWPLTIVPPFLSLPWQQTALPAWLAKFQLDAFLGPAFVLPWWGKTPSAVTIHDLTPFHPECAMNEATRRYLKTMIPSAIRRAHKVVTVSPDIAAEVVSRFNIRPTKVTVIPPVIELPDDISRKPDCHQRLILSLASVEPRKNLVRLIQAFDQFATQVDVPVKLVLAGRLGADTRRVEDAIVQARHKADIVLAGYVPETEKLALLNRASVVVSTSLYEGFLMPVVEAMQAGVPVLSHRVGILKNAPPGSYYCLQDTASIQEIVSGLKLAVTCYEGQMKMTHVARQWASQFKTRPVGDLLATMFEEIVSSARDRPGR